MIKYFTSLAFLMVLTGCYSDNSLELSPEDRVAKDFKWNFNKDRKLHYSFSSESENNIYDGLTERDNYFHQRLTGILLVEPKRNGTADFYTIENEILLYEEDGSVRDTMNMEISNREKGRKPEKGSGVVQLATIYDMIFPLPQDLISVGETTEYKVKRAINVHGISGFVLGTYKLVFDRYEEMLGRKCAVLEGELEISDLSMLPTSDNFIESSLSASGTFYFDLENRNYVAADVEIEENMHFIPDDDNAFPSESKTDGTSVIKVRLDTIQ